MENPETGASAPSDYVSQSSFDELQLSEPLRRGIAERGYTTPTPVQSATFGPILAGRDVIVRSKTGTGKTAAFGIPILERVPGGRRKPSALVMCPTRELALQVSEELAALGKHKDLTVVTVYGGASMGEQLDRLKKGAEIVVGTPGRIYDHIRRGTLKLDEVMVSCLDEADEMLNMGFFEEVTRILDHLPDGCQQLLFSATVPADIEQIVRDYLTDPETILLSGEEYSVQNIHNVLYHTVDAYPKPRNLLYMVETEEPDSAIVFCNTRSDTSLVTAVLNRNGYDAELLNGDLPQKERERVMGKVKRGELRFMVATDIAARGIDISDLTHVINYSLPEDAAVYLHRVGRTGRIGKKGTAVSLVSGAEIMVLSALQKKYGITFEEKKLPTPEEARRRWIDRHVGELKEGMSTSIFEAFIPLAQELKNRPDGDYLVSFALKYFFTHHRIERMQDLAKAEHKLERREHREEKPREGRRRSRGDRGERREHGDRREGRRDGESREGEGGRGAEPAAAADAGGAPAATEPAGGGEAAGATPERGEGERRSLRRRERGGAGDGRRGERGGAGDGRRGERGGAGDGRRGERGGAGDGRRGERGGAAEARPESAGGGESAVESPGAEAAVGAPSEEVGAAAEATDPRARKGRIYLTLGRNDGVDEAKVRDTVAQLAPGVELLAVDLRSTHSFLEVMPEDLDRAVEALHGKPFGEKTLAAEKARRRRR